jgi:hypothetical protein
MDNLRNDSPDEQVETRAGLPQDTRDTLDLNGKLIRASTCASYYPSLGSSLSAGIVRSLLAATA